MNIRVAPDSKASFSVTVVLSGLLVTSMHGYLNAMWYSKHCTYLDWEWFTSPICLFGLTLYEISFLCTLYSEHIMRNLRDLPSKAPPAQQQSPHTPPQRYKIPKGFLFNYVSSPQYFTELTGFLGWAIMTWSPAGLFIFLISCANLIPRAVASHKWYVEKFRGDYPVNRKQLIPFVW